MWAGFPGGMANRVRPGPEDSRLRAGPQPTIRNLPSHTTVSPSRWWWVRKWLELGRQVLKEITGQAPSLSHQHPAGMASAALACCSTLRGVHLSTAERASLEWLAGQELPTVRILAAVLNRACAARPRPERAAPFPGAR
jgi:hypothetical protein